MIYCCININLPYVNVQFGDYTTIQKDQSDVIRYVLTDCKPILFNAIIGCKFLSIISFLMVRASQYRTSCIVCGAKMTIFPLPTRITLLCIALPKITLTIATW